MGRSESGLHAQKRRVRAGLTLSAGALVAGCASLVALEHRSCPCADGWVCCEATSLCLRPEESCVAGGQGGSAGTSVASGGSATGGRGGASGASSGTGGNAGSATGGTAGNGGKGGTPQGGQAGTAGASGDGGMGGEPPPEWRPVGPALLEEPMTTSEADLELAPDGTPYLAFRGCEDCDLLTLTHVPVVERFDERWVVLPKDGLPSTTVTTPSLSIDTDGTLHLLVDRVVSSFDGDVWQPLASALPGTTATDSNFQIDGDGNYWATLFDGTSGEISVAEYSAGDWAAVGTAVSGRKDGVRLVVGSDGTYLAHSATDGLHVFVRKLVGTDWVSDELDAELVELAQAPDGTLYAATWKGPSEVTLYQGTIGALSPIGTLVASWAPPGLRFAADGTLFAAFMSDDFINVDRWDGMNFRDLDGPLGQGATPVLRLFEAAGGVVPFAAYPSGAALVVKKYE